MSPLLAHLADASVRALLLALIAWSALRIAGVRRTAVQHAVWTLALAGMLLLPALSFSGMPRMALHVLKSAPPPAPLAHPVSVVKPPPASPMVKTAPAARPAKRKEPVDWTTRGYIAVAGFLLLRLIAGACLARKLVRRSRRVNDPRFRESDAVKVPITSGLLRPVVLLPCCWRDWPPWKLNAVVEHELSHVRRGDLLVAFCAALNRSIFWFHPLAWWLERRLAALAEQASDDCSIAATADRARYAQALLEVAASLGPRGRRIAWQGLAMSHCSAVSRRIDRILDLRESLGGILSRRGWLALFTCAAPVFYAAGALMLQSVEYTGKLKPDLVPSPWIQVDEPMRPATPEERAALPQPVAAPDEVFLGRLTFWKEKGGLRLALVRSNGKPAYLYADTNFNGILESTECHEIGADRETTIHLSLARGPVRHYPIRIRIMESEGMPAPAWSPFAFTEGTVNVAGRNTLVWYQFDLKNESVHPDYGWEGMDTNGDGKIDTHPVRSPEFAFARDEMVVFRVGGHYVATKSVDLATGRIVLRAAPASGYERIELEVGKTVPDFEFTDFAGRPHRFSEFRGKYVLLDFWGSWCGPCVRDMPVLQRAYDQLRSRGFEILGMDDDEEIGKAKQIVAKAGVTWLQANARKVIQKRFRVRMYPTTVLVDAQGKIISIGDGDSLRDENLIPTLERVLPRR